jgi:hypothetical protein
MMHPVRSPLARALLLALAGLAAGCAKKVTTVDPGFVPEGRPTADAKLVVWPDLPVTVIVRNDIDPPGPSALDTQKEVDEFRVSTPVTVHGLIADHTSASAFQLLRRDPNGGYRPPWDFLLTPQLKFVDLDWELYGFQDTHPSGFSPPTYVARGVVSNVITPNSPLTNTAQLVPDTVSEISVASDSLRTISWSSVANAAGYYVQLYTFTGGLPGNIPGAAPAPLEVATVRNTFIAWVPVAGGEVDLTSRVIVPAQFYFVRVSAVDASGELVGFSTGDSAIVQGSTTYQLFARGARVFPAAVIHTPVKPALQIVPAARMAQFGRLHRTLVLNGGRIAER